jgi:hypothetical protein
MTLPVHADPPADDQKKQDEPAERIAMMKRRGLFAAAAALFAGIIAKPSEVAATAGGGPDGNMVLGSNFTNSLNTANQITVVTPGAGTWLAGSPVIFDAEANTGVGLTNMTALYGHAKGTGSGVMGVSSGSSAGHHSSDLPNTGVIGYGVGDRIGVAGFSDTNWAVLGTAGTGGVGVYGISPFVATVGLAQGTSAIGVYGQTSGASGYGVLGSATAVGGIGVYGLGNPWAGVFGGGVFINGALTVVNGAKSAAVPHPDGSLRRLYCVESPESWFEDFGEGQLVNGAACVTLDPDFLATVKDDGYHVFLTPNGECEGLYIESKRPEGFDVREQRRGTANLTFSYRVVAKRKDIAGPRFEKVESPDFSAFEKLKPLDVPQPPQEVRVSDGAAGRS